jgi:hypothetical protein
MAVGDVLESIGYNFGRGFASEYLDRPAMPQALSGRPWLEKLCARALIFFRCRNNFYPTFIAADRAHRAAHREVLDTRFAGQHCAANLRYEV